MTDDMLLKLLGENAALFAAFKKWSDGQIMLLAGTTDDPASYNKDGGKDGALGYYPVVNVNDQTIYVPCVARLASIALGGANAETLDALIAMTGDKLEAVDAATAAARTQAASAEMQAGRAKAQADAIGDISAARDQTLAARDVVTGAAASIVASVDTIAANRGGMGVMTIGRPAIGSTSTSGAAAGTYIYAEPAQHTTICTRLRVRNPRAQATTIHLGRSTIADGIPTPVGPYVAVEVPAGPAIFSLPIAFAIGGGQYLAISTPANGIAYEDAAGDSGGYWRLAAEQSPGGVALGSKTTTVQLQVGIEGLYALAHDDVVALLRPSIDTAQVGAAAGLLAASAMATTTIGRPDITSTTNNAAAGGTYVYPAPASRSGVRTAFRFRNGTGVARTVTLRRLRVDGDVATPIGAGVDVVIPAGPGSFVVPANLYLARGDNFGFSCAVGCAYDTGVAGDDGGYWRIADAAPTGPFALSGKVTNIQLQVGIDGTYARAFDDALGILQPQVDTHTGQIATTSKAADANTALLAKLTDTAPDPILTRAAGVTAGFLPVSGTTEFRDWAIGFMGTDLPGLSFIRRLTARLNLAAGTTRVEAMLYSRPAATLSAPSAADVAEWPAAVVVDASAIAKGAYTDVTFAGPLAVARDAGRGYYLFVRAFDANGAAIALGCGNGGAGGAGAAYNQLQRGFYRSVGSGTVWQAGSNNVLLPLRVDDNKPIVRTTALPDGIGTGGSMTAAAPKVRVPGSIGAYGWMTRAEYELDNGAAGTTHRMILGHRLPIDALQPILAHGGAGQLTIGSLRAGALATASGGSYSAASVEWKPGTFGGKASGIVPARPATRTWGILVGDIIKVPSRPRTDVSGAPYLTVIDAYVATAGTVTVMGRASDGYPSLTPWASHPTNPRAYLRTAGDCIGGGVAFSSTALVSNTVIVGFIGYWRGQVVAITVNGDSRFNAEGSAISYYGAGEMQRACYSLEAEGKHGYVSLNAGWSGSTMAEIVAQHAAVRDAGILADIAYFPGGSPNGIPGAISDAQIAATLASMTDMLARSALHGERPIVTTWEASNSSVKAYGASDAKRVAYNADQIRPLASRGVPVVDRASVLDGAADSTGQLQMKASVQSDGIHADDRGLDALMPAAKTTVTSCAIARAALVAA